MEIAMIGLGRMGGRMAEHLMAAGHGCVVHDRNPEAMAAVAGHGARAVDSLDSLTRVLAAPRIIWLMLPAAVVDDTLAELVPLLSQDDVVVDGGNSHYRDSMARARRLAAHGVQFIDVGTSGGVHGREFGYCQMIGGDAATVTRLEPLFAALATGSEARAGHLHCGAAGSGHFVKMVHNAVEYGVMQAYAEGFNLLQAASDLETPLDLPLDLAAVAEVWRNGSVVRSWLLDLIADALARDPELADFSGAVGDSGEGRWAMQAAVGRGVPVPTLAAALFARFDSSGNAEYADRVLSAMRFGFGGHGQGGPQR